MAKAHKRRRSLWLWVGGIFLVLALALAGTLLYLSHQWKPILGQKLQELVSASTDELYRLEYDEISLNLMSGNAELQQVHLIPDTQRYKTMVGLESAPDMLYDISLPTLQIRGFSLRQYLLSKKISVGELRLFQPSVTVFHEKLAFNDTLKTDTAKSLYDLISGNLKSIRVGKISLNEATLSYEKTEDSVLQISGFEKLNLVVRDVLVDSLSEADSSRLYFAKSFELELPDFRHNTADSFYYVGFDSLKLNSATNQLTVIGFKYAPTMNKAAYFRKRGVAKDMVILDFQQLHFSDLDYKALLEDFHIKASSLRIDSGVVEVSNDFRYRRLSNSKVGNSPHQRLMKLKQLVQLDSVFVDGVDVTYAEMSGKYEREGVITFNRAGGWLANVTNDSTVLASQPRMTADLSAYLMNRGRLSVLFGFDMLDERGAYTYKGTLTAMDGRAINRILTPLLNVEVATANIKGINFDMRGTDYRNWGTFNMEYDNLKINILQENDEGDRSTKTLISFLANQLLVHSSNPDARGNYHVGKIDYQRVPEFSFFKTLWKSLFEGIKQSGGISAERENRIMNIAEFFKNPFQSRDKKD